MPALPLSEAVERAQEAIRGGDYRGAVETCRRVLGQFPEFAAAHRLLGEAYLEQHDGPNAQRAFHETLLRDPQNVPAYVGLGLLAEERGDARAALAYLQVAWETAPHRRDLRDHVVRLSQRLYGADGTLHLTRPALASLHCRAGRWSRAAAECAAVLAEHPTRIDVRLRMAEALWRGGDDAGAAAACRAVLAEAPLAVVALLILADIERRQGHTDEAARLLERARAVDPAGVRAADLIMVGMDEQAAFFAVDTIPVVEERPEPEPEPERPRIAPAPDFTAPLGQRPGRGLDAGGLFPTSAELEAARPSDT
ncbi:MAG: tetratricopeptide repeat protein, partial [Thermomicrobiaceae bacterium]|nr:tetratricopeptide repeat protein [Thermomicrobiaceae bacterium]